jgi:hypothetical protein
MQKPVIGKEFSELFTQCALVAAVRSASEYPSWIVKSRYWDCLGFAGPNKTERNLKGASFVLGGETVERLELTLP